MTTRVLNADERLERGDVAIYSEEYKYLNKQNPGQNEYIIKGLAGYYVSTMTHDFEMKNVLFVAVLRKEK